jgi:hypothetical protein
MVEMEMNNRRYRIRSSNWDDGHNRLLTILALVGIAWLLIAMLFSEAIPSITHPPPPLPQDRPPLPISSQPGQPELEVIKAFPPQIASLVASYESRFTPLDIGGSMPDFPDCSHLGIEACKWIIREATTEEGQIYDINIMHKGRVIGNAQALEMQTADMVLPAQVAETSDTIWLTAVRVSRGLRMNGLGDLLRAAIDRTIGITLTMEGGDVAYHLFYDSAGWLQAVLAKIPPELIIYQDAEMMVYMVLPW